MNSVFAIEAGLVLIDHRFQGTPGVIASYLVGEPDSADLTLIEAGPASTTDTLLAGVREAGFEPERITQVLLTHIHLDHAGACGGLATRLPHARFLVHPAGAPHLVDPARLLASAGRIYGDRMGSLWGEMLPLSADRVTVLADGERVRAGGRTLVALHTPGHAGHHIAYHEAEAGWIATGDVAAVRLGGAPHVRPPTPPPEVDLPAWRRSIERLRALRARRLLLTHFGAYDDPDWHLDDLLARLFRWVGWTEARVAAGADAARISAELAEQSHRELVEAAGSDALAGALDLATNFPMSADGLIRYLRKRDASPAQPG